MTLYHVVIGGAYAISPYGKLPVYGMEITIEEDLNDVQEGAMITNLNFHTGSPPPVVDPSGLSGPV